MKTSIVAIALGLTTALTQAADIPEPVQQPVSIGDSWTFKRTAKGQSIVVSRTIFKIAEQAPNNKYIYQSMRAEIDGIRPANWRNAGKIDMDSCMTDFFGGGSLGITNTCKTTFVPGMDWTTEETVNGVKTSQRNKVIGPEEVTVGAGSFQAVKIESHWDVTRVLNPGRTPAKYGATERYYFVYWYAPEAKTMVKTEREYRTGSGAVTSRATDELDAFRLQKPR